MEDRGKEKIKESSSVILAGGKSRRMGSPKSELRIGSLSFLDKLVYEFSGFPELLISVDRRERHPDMPYPMVRPAGGALQCIEDLPLSAPLRTSL